MRRLLGLLIVLVGVSPAHAATVTPRAPGEAVPVALVRGSEQIAQRLFPDSPCAGRVRVDVNVDMRGLGSYLDPSLAGQHPGGLAYPAECRMEIGTDVLASDAALWCTVFVHEYGHLDGRDHDDGRGWRGVMDRAPRVLDWCVRVMHMRADGTMRPLGVRGAQDLMITAVLSGQLSLPGLQVDELEIGCRTGARYRTWRCTVAWGAPATVRRVSLRLVGAMAVPVYRVLRRPGAWR